MKNIIRIGEELINADLVGNAWIHEFRSDGEVINTGLKMNIQGKENVIWWKNDHNAAIAALEKLQEAMKGKPQMLNEVSSDIKCFVKDNRHVIYWIAVAFLADQLFFKGAFRERIHAMVEKLISKVEKKVEDAK